MQPVEEVPSRLVKKAWCDNAPPDLSYEEQSVDDNAGHQYPGRITFHIPEGGCLSKPEGFRRRTRSVKRLNSIQPLQTKRLTGYMCFHALHIWQEISLKTYKAADCK